MRWFTAVLLICVSAGAEAVDDAQWRYTGKQTLRHGGNDAGASFTASVAYADDQVALKFALGTSNDMVTSQELELVFYDCNPDPIAHFISATVVLPDDTEIELPFSPKISAMTPATSSGGECKGNSSEVRIPITQESLELLRKGATVRFDFQRSQAVAAHTFSRYGFPLRGTAKAFEQLFSSADSYAQELAGLARQREQEAQAAREYARAMEQTAEAEEAPHESEARIRASKLLSNFEFPDRGCKKPREPYPHLSDGISALTRFDNQSVNWIECSEKAGRDDYKALRRLVLDLGGKWTDSGDSIQWSVKRECDCIDEVKKLFAKIDERRAARDEITDRVQSAVDTVNNEIYWDNVNKDMNRAVAEQQRRQREWQQQQLNQPYITNGIR